MTLNPGIVDTELPSGNKGKDQVWTSNEDVDPRDVLILVYSKSMEVPMHLCPNIPEPKSTGLLRARAQSIVGILREVA